MEPRTALPTFLAQASMSGNPLIGGLIVLVFFALALVGGGCLAVFYFAPKRGWLGGIGCFLAAPFILGMVLMSFGGSYQSPQITKATWNYDAVLVVILGVIAAILYSLKRFAQSWSSATDQDRFWESDGTLLASLLAKAYDQHPARFQFPAGDDEAQVEGLAAYFSPDKPWSFSWKPETGQIISPQGDIVVIVVDRDGDGRVRARGATHTYVPKRSGTFPCTLLRVREQFRQFFWLREPGWSGLSTDGV